jgi:toxin ParE1/3/4
VNRAAKLIGEHPEIGRMRPEIARQPFRVMPLIGYPYVVVYEANRRPPLIARIVHGARDLPEVLSDL